MPWLDRVVTFGAGAAVGAIAALLWIDTPGTVRTTLQDLGQAQEQAQRLQNRVVSSRHLVEGQPLPHDAWRPAFPWDSQTIWPGVAAPPATAVVFVHGYNVTEAGAIGSGNYLRQETTSAGCVATSAFYTFTWTGDYGPAFFDRARAGARASGQALAVFVQQLRAQVPNIRIVLLAHSLGSQVALEALGDLMHQKALPIDALLLVQPAVPMIDLYRGKVGMFVSGSRVPSGLPELVSSWEHRGAFIDRLAMATTIVSTSSRADEVLAAAFYANEGKVRGSYSYVPDIFTSLGTAGVDPMPVPHFTVLPLEGTSLPAASREHSGLFATPDLLRLLCANYLASF